MKRTLLFSLFVALTLPLLPYQWLPGGGSRAYTPTSADRPKVSADLAAKIDTGRGKDLVQVIIQPVNEWDSELDLNVRRAGASGLRRFQNFNPRVVTLSARAAMALALRKDVAYVSLDREVRTLGHVSYTTGADAVRSSSGSNNPGVDGTGIGIAVIDSGIDTSHKAFLDKSNTNRVVISHDFTGENRVDDPYGHGTHVAALSAGNGRISNAQYIGIAPNATILNLRVLNSQGVGTTAAVLGALDWVATNRGLYNIRVVNMSLGMAAVDSYSNDPVCGAVRSLVDAGIVVVAAAGNNGRDGDGNKVYGHIHSPGNEPSAIQLGLRTLLGQMRATTTLLRLTVLVDLPAASGQMSPARNTTTI